MIRTAATLALALLAGPASAGSDLELFQRGLDQIAPRQTDLTPPRYCTCTDTGDVGQLTQDLAENPDGTLRVYLLCAVPSFHRGTGQHMYYAIDTRLGHTGDFVLAEAPTGVTARFNAVLCPSYVTVPR